MIPTFDDAVEEHATVRAIAEKCHEIQITDKGRDVWEAITMPSSYVAKTELGKQVRFWAPIDSIPLVRARSVIAAGYAFACVCEAVAKRVAQSQPVNEIEVAREAWAEFEKRRALANNVEEGYGADLSAAWELARDVQAVGDVRVVEQIAKMAGRMYKVLCEEGPRVEIDGPAEVRDVERGGDVEKLVAEETAQLFEEGLDDQARIRLMEKQSSQYRTKSVVPGARGPLVIMKDESGSMHDDGEGNRNSWCAACCVALARVAHDGGRMASVVHYSTVATVTDLKPGDHKAVLDMSRHFLSGGTAIAQGIKKGIERVKALAEAGHGGADLVLCTDGGDGDYRSMDAQLDIAERERIQLWTVAIECDIHKDSPIVKRAKEVVRVGRTDRADFVAALKDAATNIGWAPPPEAAGQRMLN